MSRASANAMLSTSSKFIEAGKFLLAFRNVRTECQTDDDDDLDEEDIPAFAPQGIVPGPVDKGKARAPDPPPASTANISPGPPVLGNIASPNAPNKPSRQTVGGLRVETRYVCFNIFRPLLLTH